MDIALSLVVLTIIALVIGATFLVRRGNRQQAVLMLVLAAVMAANVALWSLPTDGGTIAASTPH